MSAATFQSEFKGNVVCILTSPPSFQIPKTWKHDFSRAKQEISDNMSAALELLYATQFDFISVCSQILVDCKQNYFWKSSHMCAIERYANMYASRRALSHSQAVKNVSHAECCGLDSWLRLG